MDRQLFKKLILKIRFYSAAIFYFQYTLKALSYAYSRDGLERAFGRPPEIFETFETPGKMLRMVATDRGACFFFERSELEATFLAPDLVRIDWKPGLEPIPYSIARSEWEPVAIRSEPGIDGWTLKTEALGLTVGDDGSVRLQDGQGQELRRELPPQKMREGWTHRVRLRREEQIYGLGGRASSLNLRGDARDQRTGKSYRMWNFDMAGRYGPGADPLYICIPLYLGLHAQGSYLVFYENSFAANFSFDAHEGKAAFEGGPLRYYLCAGTPARLIERYTELTGRPPLPPRWALGYHQSRWGYKDQAGVREAFLGFKEHNLPLAAIHLDIDVLDGLRAFTIDPDRFPDLKALTGELHAAGVKLVSIVNPGVKIDHESDRFREGQAQKLFCSTPMGEIIPGPVWPGWCAFPDYSNPLARHWWGRQYDFLLDQGMDGFWHDMNEPAIFVAWGDRSLPGRATRHHMEGRGGNHLEFHNLYGLLQARTGYESLCEYRPEHRPFIVSRAGWAGLQRYAWTWTGDVESSWGALRQTVGTVVGLGLSGIPHSGPDIGGFQGNPSAELYLRWFQMATFFSFCRTHSSNNVRHRQPWTYGEPTLGIIRTFLNLRYQLLPYLYTLSWQASRTGVAPVRPLFWPEGDDPALWGVEDAFFLGEALMVCPVVENGGRAREVILPAGIWYNFWDDTTQEGPGKIRLDVPLEQIGLLVRAGSILPLEQPGQLTWHVYCPEAGESHQTVVYTDAGDGYGPHRLDRLSLVRTDGGIEITWETEGDYDSPYTSYRVQLHGASAVLASIDRQDVSIEKNGVQTGRFRHLRFQLGSV